MGNKNSYEITIKINRANFTYDPGETISGTIDVYNKEGKEVKPCDIFVDLMGEIGYKKTYSDGDDDYVQVDDFFPFYYDRITFPRSQVEHTMLMFTGRKYSWPFQFKLPVNFPPTMTETKSHHQVRYYLQVRPQPNLRRKDITVRSRVNLYENPLRLQPTSFEEVFEQDIKLRCALNHLGYVPGESIIVTIAIDNPRNILIKNIHLNMFNLHKIGDNSRQSAADPQILPDIVNCNDRHLRTICSIKIPYKSTSLSCQHQGGMVQTANVNIRYMLEIAVEAEAIYRHFRMYIPITKRTEPIPDLYQQISDSMIVSSASNSEQSMSIYKDIPPTYESVMQHPNNSIVYL